MVPFFNIFIVRYEEVDFRDGIAGKGEELSGNLKVRLTKSKVYQPSTCRTGTRWKGRGFPSCQMNSFVLQMTFYNTTVNVIVGPIDFLKIKNDETWSGFSMFKLSVFSRAIAGLYKI